MKIITAIAISVICLLAGQVTGPRGAPAPKTAHPTCKCKKKCGQKPEKSKNNDFILLQPGSFQI